MQSLAIRHRHASPRPYPVIGGPRRRMANRNHTQTAPTWLQAQTPADSRCAKHVDGRHSDNCTVMNFATIDRTVPTRNAVQVIVTLCDTPTPAEKQTSISIGCQCVGLHTRIPKRRYHFRRGSAIGPDLTNITIATCIQSERDDDDYDSDHRRDQGKIGV